MLIYFLWRLTASHFKKWFIIRQSLPPVLCRRNIQFNKHRMITKSEELKCKLKMVSIHCVVHIARLTCHSKSNEGVSHFERFVDDRKTNSDI